MKRCAIALVTVLVAVLFTLPAFGQAGMGTVKGTVSDEKGPIAGAEVEWFAAETGRRVRLKTNRRGEYFSLGVPFGVYKVTVSKDGKQLWSTDGYRVAPGAENVLDFDLAKERADALQKQQEQGIPTDLSQITEEQKAKLSEEQQAEVERLQKEREKVKNLNDMLAEAGEAQKTGNHAQAVSILQEATTIDPSQHVLWARLGDALIQAGQFGPAADAFQRAIAIRPSGPYFNNMGQALVRAGRSDEALQAYTKAAEVEPANAAQYFYNLGATLTNAGKIDEAIAAFDKAIAANPNHAESHYWKGVNLIGKATLQGDKMVAPPGTAESLNKYLELQPDGQFAGAAKELLATIGAKVETEIGRPRRRR